MPLPPPAHARHFVAISVPDAIRNEIQTAQEILRRSVRQGGVRWTRTEQFHLTLRFLGDVVVERVDQLVQVLQLACAKLAPPNLRAEGIGFFPSARRPRVAWVGVKDFGNHLEALQQTIQAATADFTVEPPEARFSGHVTLGRIKTLSPPEVRAVAKAADGLAGRVFGDWTASTVELVESQPAAAGATYVCRTSLPLAGVAPRNAD